MASVYHSIAGRFHLPKLVSALVITASVSLISAGCASATQSQSVKHKTVNSIASKNGPTASISVWFVSNPGPVNNYMTSLANKFDKTHHGDHISINFIANTPFKQKLLVAMSANKPPTLFFSWGGGVLEQYIKAGDAAPIAAPSTSWVHNFLPSSLGAVTFNNKIYGVPIQGTQPVFFYYNKTVFSKYHISFPTTWKQLLADITKFRKDGLSSPIEMGNLSGWEGLMYLEYLTDRIGGPQVFEAIQSHKSNSWSNPAVKNALVDIQQLVKAGAFQKGFDAVDFGSETDALLYTGRAAMTLMGNWEVSSLLGEDAPFVNKGELGQAPFPAVGGGKGNPADLEGNTTDYLAMSNHVTAAQKYVAKLFLQDEFTNSAFANTEVASGQVPVIKGSLAPLRKASLSRYLVPTYNAVSKAPHFQYSWDQSLGSQLSTPLYLNLSKVFELTETPQQFIQAMNKAMTSISGGL